MKFEDFPQDMILNQISIKELKSYAKVFLEEKDDRLERLIDRVSSDLEIDKSKMDFSEESLDFLSKWYYSKIEFAQLTQEEYEAKRASIPEYIEISSVKFSQDTFSLIYEVGIYFGETMIHKYPHLKWEQTFRKTVNYGHMIIKLDKLPMQPAWLMSTICWRKYRKNEEIELHKLFNVWEQYV